MIDHTVTRRLIQLLLSCLVLGAGVSLLLAARLGSDGYSTLLSGLVRATGISFLTVSVAVGAALLAMAWWRGLRPGVGTLAQTVVVGLTVHLLLPVLPAPEALGWRLAEMTAGLLVLAVGVAGYLAVQLGSGPTEAAAQAWQNVIPFKWGYSLFQLLAMVIGWLCGADVGIATVAVVVLLGWLVDRIQPWLTPAGLPPTPRLASEPQPG